MEALRAAGSGYNVNSQPVPIDGNKRLARVGSHIMKTAILSDWYASGAERGEYNQQFSVPAMVDICNQSSLASDSTGLGRTMYSIHDYDRTNFNSHKVTSREICDNAPNGLRAHRIEQTKGC